MHKYSLCTLTFHSPQLCIMCIKFIMISKPCGRTFGQQINLLSGSAKAAGTVTAIVGGIGSLGSAVGPAFVGHMISLNSTTVDFTFISWVLSGGMIMAGAAIVSTSIREVKSVRE